MKALDQYDETLQMFRDQPRAVDMARPRFIRWLVERGRLEHPIAGPSSGGFTTTAPLTSLESVAA